MLQAIQNYAQTHLSHLGYIEIKNFQKRTHGFYEAIVLLRTLDRTEYYTAYAGNAGVHLMKTKIESLNDDDLPLFS